MAASSKTAAIVDDDDAILQATSSFLESMGIRAFLFGSAEAFLASGCGHVVSYLLSDISMPGLGGLALLSIVRLRHPTLTVILMTALNDDRLRDRALAGGARCLLVKPILAVDLIRCMGDP